MKGTLRGSRIVVVGPLPPPAGGMANQTRQLASFLEAEGLEVDLVRQNRPYTPVWVGRIPWLRAVGRLIGYLRDLWRAASGPTVFHIMANSGWSWHLFAAPAILVAKLRRAAVVVNYRGGKADAFFRHWYWSVGPMLSLADAVVVPSGFLGEVFRRRAVDVRVVPNIIDIDRFRPDPTLTSRAARGTHLVVARNLEAIYDNATAVRAFRIVKDQVPDARLTIAGTGPEGPALHRLVNELGLSAAVAFAGHVDNARMPDLYRSATVALNPSLVDNMPISILEALASGVPVVSTDVGGIPYLVEEGRTALLVPPGAPERMAEAVLRLLGDADLVSRLVRAGCDASREYAWERIRDRWFEVYEGAVLKLQSAGRGGKIRGDGS